MIGIPIIPANVGLMTIDLVINGYFRSGSTMMWNLVKKSNPDLLCMYEPFHPELFRKLITDDPNKSFELHKLAVWSDYFKLDQPQLEKLRKLHNIEVVPLNFEKWSGYIDFISYLSNSVFLQPNRAHFILEELHKNYSCPTIHLVRNPLDTMVSFGLVDKQGNPVPDIPSKGSNLTKKAKRVFTELSKSKNSNDFLYLTNFFLSAGKKGHSISNYSYKETYEILVKNNFIKKPEFEPDNLDKFLLVWTAVNIHAKKQIENIGKSGFYLHYENIVSDPQTTLAPLKTIKNIKIDPLAIEMRKTAIREFPEPFKKQVHAKIEKLGIVELVKSILGEKLFNNTFF